MNTIKLKEQIVESLSAIRYVVCGILLTISLCAQGRDYVYRVQAGDTFETIAFSLGYVKFKNEVKNVNLFLFSELVDNSQLYPGRKILIPSSSIKLEDNIIYDGNFIRFKTRIENRSQYRSYVYPLVKGIRPKKKKRVRSLYLGYGRPFTFYIGAGLFVSSFKNSLNQVNTETQSGLQPHALGRIYYSQSKLGSVALDLSLQKTINNQFNLPLNISNEISYLPKWNLNGRLKLTLNHSMLSRGLITQGVTDKLAAEVTLRSIGLGAALPMGRYSVWGGVEKLYYGKISSSESKESITNGILFKAELFYFLNSRWSLIPRLTYGTFHAGSSKTSFAELKCAITREISF